MLVLLAAAKELAVKPGTCIDLARLPCLLLVVATSALVSVDFV